MDDHHLSIIKKSKKKDIKKRELKITRNWKKKGSRYLSQFNLRFMFGIEAYLVKSSKPWKFEFYEGWRKLFKFQNLEKKEL
jgi:hypothetical protein